MPKEILTVYFKDKEIEIYERFCEIANGKKSPTAVKAIEELVQRYQVSPINSKKSEFNAKIEEEINLINNSDYWNKIIPQLSEEQLKILESATHSLEIKASKQLHFGSLRN